MKTYTARFTGRNLGAIGISHYIVTEVKGENEEKATLALYDRYEHIQGLKLEEHGKDNSNLAQ